MPRACPPRPSNCADCTWRLRRCCRRTPGSAEREAAGERRLPGHRHHQRGWQKARLRGRQPDAPDRCSARRRGSLQSGRPRYGGPRGRLGLEPPRCAGSPGRRRVGLDFEDTDHEAGALADAELQADGSPRLRRQGATPSRHRAQRRVDVFRRGGSSTRPCDAASSTRRPARTASLDRRARRDAIRALVEEVGAPVTSWPCPAASRLPSSASSAWPA